MLNRFDMFMVKVAETAYDRWKRDRQRSKNIQKALNRSRPKSRKEMQVERLAGRQYTAGQMARGGTIGAGVGAVGRVMAEGIQHGKKGLVGTIKNPRKMLASAVQGTLVGSVVPTLKRKADVAAAEGGWY